MAIMCELGLLQLMLSTILKDKWIGDAVKLSALVKSTVFAKELPGLIDDMGKFLDIRMEDQIQKRTPRSLLRQVFFHTLQEYADDLTHTRMFIVSKCAMFQVALLFS